MNRRRLMVLGFAVGTTCLLAVLLNQNPRKPILRGNAIGAEPKAQKRSILIRENGAIHDAGDKRRISAYREMTSGDATAIYGVDIYYNFLSRISLPIESAQDLIVFYEKHKNSKKSNATEVRLAEIHWYGVDSGGNTVVIGRSLGDGKEKEEWDFIDFKNKVGDEFFTAIKAAIEDCKALKAVPFSVKP